MQVMDSRGSIKGRFVAVLLLVFAVFQIWWSPIGLRSAFQFYRSGSLKAAPTAARKAHTCEAPFCYREGTVPVAYRSNVTGGTVYHYYCQRHAETASMTQSPISDNPVTAFWGLFKMGTGLTLFGAVLILSAVSVAVPFVIPIVVFMGEPKTSEDRILFGVYLGAVFAAPWLAVLCLRGLQWLFTP